MSFDQVLQALFGGALLGLGWFCNTVFSATQELKEDLSDLRVNIAEKYLPKEDFNRVADELKDLLHSISDKLDNKVDK